MLTQPGQHVSQIRVDVQQPRSTYIVHNGTQQQQLHARGDFKTRRHTESVLCVFNVAPIKTNRRQCESVQRFGAPSEYRLATSKHLNVLLCNRRKHDFPWQSRSIAPESHRLHIRPANSLLTQRTQETCKCTNANYATCIHNVIAWNHKIMKLSTLNPTAKISWK
jgi:hypothetical protein